jgi:hypothetical protein
VDWDLKEECDKWQPQARNIHLFETLTLSGACAGDVVGLEFFKKLQDLIVRNQGHSCSMLNNLYEIRRKREKSQGR